jgi:methionyl-tRNA formyltransferase
MPEIGTFNLHGSLLPQYRGAAPINWAIMNGEKETGVTTFFLKHEIDTGSIIFQEKETIEVDDNVGSVYERLMARGACLVLKTVKAIQTGDYPQIVQDESVEMKHAPKIFKETCEIDWTKSSEEIYDFIRGLSPYPAAWASIADRVFKIFGVQKTEFKTMSGAPGEYETDNKTYLHIQTGGSPIAITELQMQGKKRMDIESFLRGTKL